MADSIIMLLPQEAGKRPAGRSLHWMYFFFFAMAVTAALWRHGHPVFTLAVLCSIPPLACMVYVPYKIINRDVRTILQVLVAAGAMAWGFYRFSQHVPADKVLVETIAVLGLSFVFSLRSADYGYLMLISILLLLYGALLPRLMYLIIIVVASVIGLLLLYQSRIIALAADPNTPVPKWIFLRNWRYFLLHFLMVLGVWFYIYTLMPTTDRPGRGIVEVSFRNENDSFLPPDFKHWLKTKPAMIKKSPTGSYIMPGTNPSETSKKSGPKVDAKSKEDTFTADGNGNSSGPPGDEIVFRVKSPVKLYWLAKLYNVYDGTTWTTSKNFSKKQYRGSAKYIEDFMEMRQDFIIDKWLCPILYSAYKGTYFQFSRTRNLKTTQTFYSMILDDVYPQLPFSYEASSRIPRIDKLKAKPVQYIEKGKRKIPRYVPWNERINPFVYMKLPRKKISKRLRKLSLELTKGITNPLKKATVLRDYLRKNYKYKQFSSRVPEDREAVDYFVFDLKEGHCEYFASTLAVMARINKMPSRVATGFSPGNFNALTHYFEVREYHAHAWTQIFINGIGWLTFDATPPGEVVSRTTPIGLGSLHDPFGDEWRIMPPEMTTATKNAITEKLREMDASKKAGENESVAKSLAMKIALAPEKIGKSIDKIKDKLFKKDEKKTGFSFQKFFKTITRNLGLMFKRFVGGWQQLYLWVGTPTGNIIVVLLVFLSLPLICLPFIRGSINRHIRLCHCREWFAEACKEIESAPASCITKCYHITRELLELTGYPRSNNMELFDYGASLKNFDPHICKDTLTVLFIYSQSEYRPGDPSLNEAKIAFSRMLRLRKYLLRRLTGRTPTDVLPFPEPKEFPDYEHHL